MSDLRIGTEIRHRKTLKIGVVMGVEQPTDRKGNPVGEPRYRVHWTESGLDTWQAPGSIGETEEVETAARAEKAARDKKAAEDKAAADDALRRQQKFQDEMGASAGATAVTATATPKKKKPAPANDG